METLVDFGKNQCENKSHIIAGFIVGIIDAAADHKTDNEFFDPERSEVLAGNVLPLVIALARGTSWSLFRLNILTSTQIVQLKSELEQTLNIAPDNQEWLYKNEQLNDLHTLSMVGVKPDDIIVCERKNPQLLAPTRC